MFRPTSVIGEVTRLLPLRVATTALPRLRHRVRRSNGRLFTYGEAAGPSPNGERSPTVVLVHGWGLAHGSYKRSAEALAALGYRVVVPDLPGSGWTSDLPPSKVSFGALAGALEGFVRTIRTADGSMPEPVHVVGHSMGGAVGAQLAHDSPELVRSLVLVCAASGVTWSRDGLTERLLTERPLWDWALRLLTEFPVKEFPAAATPVLRDLGHNLLWHLPSLGVAAHITRRSDLLQELAALAERGVPVSIVRAASDKVVTQACFDDQCTAAGRTGTVVPGNHGWPLTDPDHFARVIHELLARQSV